MKTEIYTHDEAMLLVEMFEDVLIKHNIRVPSTEDEEREPDDFGLYGSTYSDLLDGVEERIIDLLERKETGADVTRYMFPELFDVFKEVRYGEEEK